MTRKTTGKYYAILALIGILCTGHAIAQEGIQSGGTAAAAQKFQATIFLIDVQPFVVPDFTINGETYYDAGRQGKDVKLPFRDLKEIRFLNPGKSFEVDVLFNDGRRETYTLQPAADIVIEGGMISEYSHTKVARIQFAPMPAQPPPSAALPAPPQPRQDAAPATSDRIVLRNGDSLSGQIQTKTFPLRAAYGTFQFDAAQIASIEFDATKPTAAVVLLKNGDKLSGTLEVESVRLTMPSGEGISFDGKTIQRIHFKR